MFGSHAGIRDSLTKIVDCFRYVSNLMYVDTNIADIHSENSSSLRDLVR